MDFPFCFCFFLLLSDLLLVAADKPPTFELLYKHGQVAVGVGTPAQRLSVIPLTTSDVFVVVDSKCGQPAEACPSFCRDAVLTDLFCAPLCQSNGQERACQLAGGVQSFEAANSTSSREMNATWTGSLAFCSNQFGRWIRDVVMFPMPESPVLRILEYPLVDGLLLDGRLLLEAGGIVGVADGRANFVRFLFENQRIPQPVLSVLSAASRWIVGGFDERRCSDWVKTKAVGTNWVVRFDSIGFLYREWTANALAAFDLNSARVYIPDEEFDRLVDEGVIFTNFNELYATIRCSASLNMSFAVGDRVLTLGNRELIDKDLRTLKCYPNVLPLRDYYPAEDELRGYNDEPLFVLGEPFLDKFCTAYDYGAGVIGFADSTTY